MGVVIDSNTNFKNPWFSVTAKKWQFFHSIHVKLFLVFSLLWLFKVSAFLKLAGGQKDTFASIWNCLWQNYEKYEWDYWWAAKYFKIAKIIGIFSFYYIFAIFCKFWIVNEIVNYIDKLAIFSTITFHESLTLVENLKRVNFWGKFVSFLRKNT